ncbi:hypothetical protein [Knoellia sp. p5-6-4]|uniref:hypothetical protein n=1 Tax=unclassified Knoellia TaxID=2618719 RepID=UPI0023D9E7AF|nr:hypothetical protein [Knoellia sp. p5-6-4]MDF2145110.1 hypothetical protein [Knoellia sp. p5-6-4]
MVTLRHTPPGPPDPDDDPTGMRALLSSLPDPGPMPDDLVARITASLAAEQQRGPVARPLHAAGPSRRTPVWRTAGLAAAAAAVIGLGAGSLLTGTAPGDVGALFGGSTSEAVSDDAAGRAPAGGGADSEAQSATSVVSIHHTNTAYTSSAFVDQARALLDDPGVTLPPLGAESPAIGPIGTETGLRSCLSALTTGHFTAALADLGSFDGHPAVVVVLTTESGRTAYAVQRTCTIGRPAPLAGPVPVP